MIYYALSEKQRQNVVMVMTNYRMYLNYNEKILSMFINIIKDAQIF